MKQRQGNSGDLSTVTCRPKAQIYFRSNFEILRFESSLVPHHSFRGLEEPMLRWVKAVLIQIGVLKKLPHTTSPMLCFWFYSKSVRKRAQWEMMRCKVPWPVVVLQTFESSWLTASALCPQPDVQNNCTKVPRNKLQDASCIPAVFTLLFWPWVFRENKTKIYIREKAQSILNSAKCRKCTLV